MSIVKRIASEEYANEKALYEALKAVENIPGKVVTGETFTVGEVDVVAGEGAENFNNLNANKATGQYSHAEGSYTTASGDYSHAEGNTSFAFGLTSHAEGNRTTAVGEHSHSEGSYTTASGKTAHAEGAATTAEGDHSHAEGYATNAIGKASHAEGECTKVFGSYAHAEGYATNAIGDSSHSEGSSTTIPSTITRNSTSEEVLAAWNEGKFTAARGAYSHAEGYDTLALELGAHSEGKCTVASGMNSHAEGYETTASGETSHAEGHNTTASGIYSHAEGYGSNTLPGTITSESTNDEIKTAWESTRFTLAKGESSHAEGKNTLALGDWSHAEGGLTTASGWWAHAEGYNTTAFGGPSHAEGSGTTASSSGSHAEGIDTVASGYASHAEGEGTIASGSNQHAQGKHNIENTEFNYAHIVGNGSSINSRSNAHTLDWEGNAWFAGDVYVGSTSGTNKDDGSKKLATEEYANNKVIGLATETFVTNKISEAQLGGGGNVDLSGYVSKDDVIDVAHGGTGKTTHTANAVLTGNGTSAVKNVATASGALYATAANGAPKFGVLPYAQGGTGKALSDVPNYAIMRNAGDGDYMWYLATGNGALFATAANGAPKFGTLPVAQGGTGATSAASARTNLGAKMKLLWTNASPTSTFESFTALTNSDLAESLANFTAILVWFNITPEATQHSFAIIPIGIGSGTDTDDVKNTTLCFTTSDNKWVRRYGWATTSAITFGTGGYKTSLSANWTVNSKYMVPERIYGIR